MTEPCIIVVFGATGNLARNKLLPALYHLEETGHLTEDTVIIGFGRRDWSDQDWQEHIQPDIEAKARAGYKTSVGDRLKQRMRFIQGDMNDPKSFDRLKIALESQTSLPSDMIFYMAIGPDFYGLVAEELARVGLNEQENGFSRLVIEKPFGYDLESSQSLDKRIHRHFREDQIYRIDHYLGKSTVQNIMVFRFANLMLEPLWNRNYIDHVQIIHSEAQGIDKRAGYYDGVGALRDMIQSHLLQMLTLVAMEPPASLDAESLRDEKVKVLRSIRPISRDAVNAQAFRAQYRAGERSGKPVNGYQDEEGVRPGSVTETYAAMKLYIDNWRWRGVPFYLRTGKRMKARNSLISIRFKHPPQQLFRETPIQQIQPNWILMNIQPHECLRIEMQVKEPGLEMHAHTTRLDASSCGLSETGIDAYEALILDVIEGDHSLFLRYDEVERAWQVVDPVLKTWAVERDMIATYPAGSWGPPESSRLFDQADQYWRNALDD